MKAKLENGLIVELGKECECVTHDDPHWIHMDNFDHEQNRELLRAAEHPDAGIMAEVYLHAFAKAELHRLNEKLKEMNKRNIVEILRD